MNAALVSIMIALVIIAATRRNRENTNFHVDNPIRVGQRNMNTALGVAALVFILIAVILAQ